MNLNDENTSNGILLRRGNVGETEWEEENVMATLSTGSANVTCGAMHLICFESDLDPFRPAGV